MNLPSRARGLAAALEKAGYFAGDDAALALFLALELGRPLLVEGPAGVGKTELARAASAALSRPLVRLQCYEGLDEAKAIYEWDYGKQMLWVQLLRDQKTPPGEETDTFFFEEKFLLARPLLQVLRSEQPSVLLVDEVDRADPEFEAVLLEILSDFQITIPEIGTVKAKHPPLVVLTTNATREMTDALRRRCLHLFLDFPPPSREIAILEAKVPGIAASLAQQLAAFAEKVRAMDLRKPPSIAESLDWARALVALGASALDPELARATLGAFLKHEEDLERAATAL